MFLPFRVLDQIVYGHRATEALAEKDQWLAFDLRRLVEPFEGRVDVLIDRRQARFTFGQAITAIVHKQHLVTIFRQPKAAAEVHGQVSAVAV
ncbi:hypothetical protein D3C78_1527970 [compost metagenome]